MCRSGKMCVANGVAEAKTSIATKRSLLSTIAGLVLHLALHHVAEHAFAHIVIVPQRLKQAVANLAGNHRRRNQLRMRMLHTGSRIGPMILENRNVAYPMVQCSAFIPLPIDSQNAGHMRIRHHCPMQREWSGLSMIDFMKTKTFDAPPQMLQAAGGLHIARQRRKLVGDHADHPGLAAAGRSAAPHSALAFIPRTKRATFHKRRDRLRHRRCVASSSGRLARSVAMMTHSLVKKFWRSSGMGVPPAPLSASRRFPTMPTWDPCESGPPFGTCRDRFESHPSVVSTITPDT